MGWSFIVQKPGNKLPVLFFCYFTDLLFMDCFKMLKNINESSLLKLYIFTIKSLRSRDHGPIMQIRKHESQNTGND